MKTMLIGLEEGALAEDTLARLREAAEGYRVVVTDDRGEIEGVLDDIEIAAGGFPRDLVARAPRLRWFQQWSAGADWLAEHPEAVGADVVVTSTSGIHAVPIGEHVFAGLLALVRRLPEAFAAQRERAWRPPEAATLSELRGKTLLLLGVGAIGLRVARLARAFDLRVVGVRRRVGADLPEGVDEVVGEDDLIGRLPEADVVVLTLPLTEATRGAIGEEELAVVKRGALLVNIGRGGLIDEGALVAALEDGRLGGAALDVFEEEPLPADSPLWAMPNVIVTAHYAGSFDRYDEEAAAVLLDNLARYLAGEPLVNVVDKAAGY